jgi:succinate dehydrogenase/fumarate reductase-like Fe-S protein
MTGKTADIHLQRGGAGEKSEIITYSVPYQEGMSVLDALIWIRAHEDPSLAIRYSCLNANACKECMIEVDGKVDYACVVRLTDRPQTIRPLANKRLIRDLVTDIVPPKETLAQALESSDNT